MAWVLFFVYRNRIEMRFGDVKDITEDTNFYLGVLIIPVLWITAYSLFDKYDNLYRLSRFTTFFRTLALTLFGVMVLFFTILSDDFTFNYVKFIKPISILILLHFGITVFFRILWLSICKRNIRSGKVAFNTAIICLLYTSPSPRDQRGSRMPSSA